MTRTLRTGASLACFLFLAVWSHPVNAQAQTTTYLGESTTGPSGALRGPVTSSGLDTAITATNVTPGSYTSANITVGADGRLTAAANGSGGAGCTMADPTATVGTSAVNGVATTCMRSDAAPKLGNLTGDVTSVGLATTLANIPAIAGTNLTGTASSLTAGHVTTNANLTGDTTSVGNGTTTVKVNGVAYGTSPGTNTLPVVTSSNTITYEAVPNAALASSSMTIAGHAVSLGGTQTIACADLSNGASGCSTATGTSGATIPLLNGANTWSAAQSIDSGDLVLKGATSGTTTLNAAAMAGSTTITLPGGTTDFSATGGTSQVVKQVSTGAALTVARLACSDLSDSGAGCTGAAAPSAANPTATISTSAQNGTAITFMRSDASPPLPATLNVVTAMQLNGVLLNSASAPTISSGCGTGSPSISGNNGTGAFEVTLGNSAATCVIGLPTAAHGWNCYASDITTTTSTAFMTKQTASATNSCTLANFTTAGASGNWANADKLRVIARAY